MKKKKHDHTPKKPQRDPWDLTTVAGRLDFAEKSAGVMLGSSFDDAHGEVLLVLHPKSPVARHIHRQLCAHLDVDVSRFAGAASESTCWAPRDWLSDAIGAHEPELREVVAAPVAEGQVRSVFAMRDDTFAIIDVTPDRVAFRDSRRELVSEEAIERDPGIRAMLPIEPRAFVVGTWRDPGMYLPAKLPPDWYRWMIDALSPARVRIARRLVIDVAPTQLGKLRTLVVMVQHASEDRLPDDAELEEVRAKLRNAERLREPAPAPGVEWLVPPGFRVLVGDAHLTVL